MIAFVLSVMACFNPIRVQIQRVLHAINKNWSCLEVGDDFCGCRKGHGRNKDFISFTHSSSFKSKMEGSRAGIDRNSMLRADHRGKFPLEIPHLRSGRQPTRTEDIDYFCYLFFTQHQPYETVESFA